MHESCARLPCRRRMERGVSGAACVLGFGGEGGFFYFLFFSVGGDSCVVCRVARVWFCVLSAV